MGFVTNPLVSKLGQSVYWKAIWCSYTNSNHKYLILTDLFVYRFIYNIFVSRKFIFFNLVEFTLFNFFLIRTCKGVVFLFGYRFRLSKLMSRNRKMSDLKMFKKQLLKYNYLLKDKNLIMFFFKYLKTLVYLLVVPLHVSRKILICNSDNLMLYSVKSRRYFSFLGYSNLFIDKKKKFQDFIAFDMPFKLKQNQLSPLNLKRNLIYLKRDFVDCYINDFLLKDSSILGNRDIILFLGRSIVRSYYDRKVVQCGQRKRKSLVGSFMKQVFYYYWVFLFKVLFNKIDVSLSMQKSKFFFLGYLVNSKCKQLTSFFLYQFLVKQVKRGRDIKIIVKFLMSRLRFLKEKWPFLCGYSCVLSGRFSRGQRKHKIVYNVGSLKLSQFDMVGRRLDYFQGIVKNRYGISGVKIVLHWSV